MDKKQAEQLGRIDERTENMEGKIEALFKKDEKTNLRIDDLEENRIRPLEKWRWILTGAFVLGSGIGTVALAVLLK